MTENCIFAGDIGAGRVLPHPTTFRHFQPLTDAHGGFLPFPRTSRGTLP